MQNLQHKQHFEPYLLSQTDLININLIQKSAIKTLSLLKGVLKRRELDLYHGLKQYNRELQKIYSTNPQEGTQFLKKKHIIHNENTILIPCSACGQYTKEYQYCNLCDNIHYCSQTCQVNYKFTHERGQCKPKMYPSILQPFLIEVHVGSDLAENVEIYYQHFCKWTFKQRGTALLKQILKQIDLTQTGYVIEQKKYGATFKKNAMGIYSQVIKPLTQDILRNIYIDNPIIKKLQIILVTNGSIFERIITEIHDNHIHYVLLFRAV